MHRDLSILDLLGMAAVVVAWSLFRAMALRSMPRNRPPRRRPRS